MSQTLGSPGLASASVAAGCHPNEKGTGGANGRKFSEGRMEGATDGWNEAWFSPGASCLVGECCVDLCRPSENTVCQGATKTKTRSLSSSVEGDQVLRQQQRAALCEYNYQRQPEPNSDGNGAFKLDYRAAGRSGRSEAQPPRPQVLPAPALYSHMNTRSVAFVLGPVFCHTSPHWEMCAQICVDLWAARTLERKECANPLTYGEWLVCSTVEIISPAQELTFTGLTLNKIVAASSAATSDARVTAIDLAKLQVFS